MIIMKAGPRNVVLPGSSLLGFLEARCSDSQNEAAENSNAVWELSFGSGVCTENSNPDVMMVKAAEGLV
jgi:hypothetical protein